MEAQSPYNRDDRALAFSLGSLAQATRGARTALWSALQATALMEVDHEVALGEKEPKVNIDFFKFSVKNSLQKNKN